MSLVAISRFYKEFVSPLRMVFYSIILPVMVTLLFGGPNKVLINKELLLTLLDKGSGDAPIYTSAYVVYIKFVI